LRIFIQRSDISDSIITQYSDRGLDGDFFDAGGIIIPDTAKEKPSQGEVIAVPIDSSPAGAALFAINFLILITSK
jgi:co-chaperonin GroES (HSP10)